LKTAVNEEGEPPSVFWKSVWISIASVPFFSQYLMAVRISIFSTLKNKDTFGQNKNSYRNSFYHGGLKLLLFTSKGPLNTIQNNSLFSSRPLPVIPRTFRTTLVQKQNQSLQERKMKSNVVSKKSEFLVYSPNIETSHRKTVFTIIT